MVFVAYIFSVQFSTSLSRPVGWPAALFSGKVRASVAESDRFMEFEAGPQREIIAF